MPQQVLTSVENTFNKGLITEATGLNFPENAATDTQNCIYSLIGDVTRRGGIDKETNGTYAATTTGQAYSTYVWGNAGGNGSVKLLVVQTGATLTFYSVNTSSNAAPLSTQILGSTVTISSFAPPGNTYDPTKEATYADGNGFLFVYHPNCDPFYCTYNAGTITGIPITINIRDFTGIPDGLQPNTRPATLSAEHAYNLQNQGWTAGNAWFAQSSSNVATVNSGNVSWTVASGITGITNGQIVVTHGNIAGNPLYCIMSGTVVSYSGTTLTLNIFSLTSNAGVGTMFNVWTFSPTNTGYINTWFTDEGNYPSNADVWWYFKDSTGVFNPTSTVPNVSLAAGNAPQGHYILTAFNQNKSAVSGVSGLTSIATTARPTNGAWFQGRVWYTGVNASQQATGDEPFYAWTENIYFSQINVGSTATNFGNCYQVNDPTSEQLFNILPTDGGVIQIQGCGLIYKLFPIQNGMLVFAANGVWFITGSQGIGFSASDYTITKISSVPSISSTSFVDVLGFPYFWNEDGIYVVQVSQSGSLSVEPITVGTIQTYYDNIPVSSKQYIRGSYHPIDYVIQWTFKSTPETSVVDRYNFDTILCFNTYNKAFYPYTISSNGSCFIHSVNYVNYAFSGVQTPLPGFKYFFTNSNNASFADEHDTTTYTDWNSVLSANFVSYFVTGYRIRGQALKKSQPTYIQILSNQSSSGESAYKIQGIWDYANNGDSGRWSSVQQITSLQTSINTAIRRHKIRGHGYVLQYKLSSVDGEPFDIIGWSVLDTVNTGV